MGLIGVVLVPVLKLCLMCGGVVPHGTHWCCPSAGVEAVLYVKEDCARSGGRELN
jgi:hypothetical protein